jgi:hypothetical protein
MPPALFKKGETALEQPGRTMLDKIWDQHVIFRVSDDTDLLHVDRHLLHDLGGSRGLLDLKSRDLAVHSPELTFATPDHAISSAPGWNCWRRCGRRPRQAAFNCSMSMSPGRASFMS